jgi:hypothetical protein
MRSPIQFYNFQGHKVQHADLFAIHEAIIFICLNPPTTFSNSYTVVLFQYMYTQVDLFPVNHFAIICANFPTIFSSSHSSTYLFIIFCKS